MKKDEAYKRAEKRVKAKIGFYIHLTIYIIVSLMLILIWRFTAGGGYQWFWWPIMGWGIAILFHGLGIFVFSGSVSERMIQKELEREKKRGGRTSS
jgi:hypothetical protein